MKKIFLCTIFLMLLVGCNKLVNENKNFRVSLMKSDYCNHVLKEYYKKDERTVYFVCLDEFNLKLENGKEISLRYYFDNVNQSFERSLEKLVSDMKIDATLKDGGTIIYKNDDYTLIMCNSIGNNRDVYIGDSNLDFHEGFCKGEKQ